MAGNVLWAAIFAAVALGMHFASMAHLSDLAPLNRCIVLAAIALSTTGWVIVIRAESSPCARFIPSLSEFAGGYWVAARGICSAFWVVLTLVFVGNGMPPGQSVLVGVLVVITPLLTAGLVAVQYGFIISRLARLRRTETATTPALGCLFFLCVGFLLGGVHSLSPFLAGMLASTIPLGLIALLAMLYTLLRPHLTPHPPSPAPPHTS